MTWKPRLSQRWAGGLVGAGMAILFGLACQFRLGDSFTRLSYDLPFRFQGISVPEEAIIIYMDDASHLELHQPFDKGWDRTCHAQLIERLTRAQAKVIAYDVVFSAASTNATADARLTEAIRKHGKVVLAGLVNRSDDPGLASEKLEQPLEAFRGAAAGWGLANLDVDTDSLNRLHFPGMEKTPSFAWAVAEVAGAEIARIPTQRLARRWFRYYGPPGTIRNVSFATALAPDELSDDLFRNRIVFVGRKPTAGFSRQSQDEFGNPYTFRWGGHDVNYSPGVEVQATAFLNLYRGDWLRRFHPAVEFATLACLGLVLGYGLVLFQPFAATVMAGLTAFGIAAGSLALWWAGSYWFSWTSVIAIQLPAAYAWSLVFNSIRLLIQKRVLEQSLFLHLSPYRVKQILGRPELLKPGAEEQEVSILFTDIANFTRLTSRMNSNDLFRLLNDYYEVALSCVYNADGTVVKLIGDAIFAIWNAPFVQPDQQERACRAALLLRDRLITFEAMQQSLPLRTRVGLHTGLAHVGNLGSSKRFDYTAIGENVNLASRLEGLNKHLGTDILATRDIQRIVENKLLSRMVGHFRLKGFDRVIEVHEMLGEMALVEGTRPWREAFAQGLYHFQRKDFNTAEAVFRRVLELHPNDGPAGFYLEKIDEFRHKPPEEEWAGEIDMKEK